MPFTEYYSGRSVVGRLTPLKNTHKEWRNGSHEAWKSRDAVVFGVPNLTHILACFFLILQPRGYDLLPREFQEQILSFFFVYF